MPEILQPSRREYEAPRRRPGDSQRTLDPRALKRLEERERLRTSKFDVVSSFLLALLWFIGAFTLFLFIIWVTGRISFGPTPFPLPIPDSSRGVNAEGFEDDFEPPGAEEVVDLSEPTIQDALTAITDAVSSVAAVIDAVTGDSAATAQGDGRGDRRQEGPGAEGDATIPRHERWELKFSAKDINGYAKQLDYHRIELGVIGGGVQGVEYVANVAGSPRMRKGPADAEQRLYFMWVDRSNPFYQYDRQLLQKAGANIGSGREMLKFIDEDLENMLAHIEKEYAEKAGYPSIDRIQKTTFESQPDGSG